MNQKFIRNFCIISHVDHGKSTLADRFLEITGTVPKEKLKPQMLDMMDLERERGVTIKLQPVRMEYHLPESPKKILNLIDTPGHVDFSYEVSRALSAVEGAILLVDATQGIQAQTVANLEKAREAGLEIIPVINKIDLPNAQSKQVADEIIQFSTSQPLFCSAKTGQGVKEILKAIVEKIPPPSGSPTNPLQALIFDSVYDPYRGVIAYIRVVDGQVKKGDKILFLASQKTAEVLEAGYFRLKYQGIGERRLSSGEIGYLITNLKNVFDIRVGDTITKFYSGVKSSLPTPLPGYKKVTPMVYANLFTIVREVNSLWQALEKLKLNDSSLAFQPIRSKAFGAGVRCGFLGLFHLEIVRERLEREYGLDLLISRPTVEYQKVNHQDWEEPWVSLEIITPLQYLGKILELVKFYRAIYKTMEYLSSERIILRYEAPLAEIITNFYDKLKSVSSGYASMNYKFIGYKKGNLIKLDILIAGEKYEELSEIVPKERVITRSCTLVKRLKELIPRQLFEVTIQAAIGGKIIARADILPLGKNVIAKLYGGDVTRKKKLLEKQKIGKKKMKKLGKVEIPNDLFLKLLK